MTKEEAVRIANDTVKEMGVRTGTEIALLPQQSIELRSGWVFFYESRRYLETGSIRDALAGNAPFIVGKKDGKIHWTGSAFPLEFYLEEFEGSQDSGA